MKPVTPFLLVNRLYFNFQMSLIPSNTAVSERLALLREERAIAKAAFRSAVEAASIEWEAELLLALEEFRDAGGFATIQDRIRVEIQRERNCLTAYRDQCGTIIQRPCVPHDEQQNKKFCDIFLPDRLDVGKALSCVYDSTALFHSGDPTMATERAALRIRILTAVKQEMRDAIKAEVDAQTARDRALVEERNRLAQEERDARSRLMRDRVTGRY